MTIDDYQCELGGVVFGHGTKAPLERIEGLGLAAVRERRYENQQDDGVRFGREYRGSKTLAFQGAVVAAGDPAEAFRISSELQDAFDGDARMTSGAVDELRIRRPGRPERVVFGRADAYDPDTAQSVIGLIGFSAGFESSDGRFYSADVHTLAMGLGPGPSSGGLVTVAGGIPSPITTLAGARRSTIVENAGNADAWPVVTIAGPILNPTVGLGDVAGGTVWALEYLGAIADGQSVTFDPRPWSRGVYLGDGSSVGGRLSRRSRPSQSKLPPGVWEFLVGGVDTTGTAQFTVAWRDGFKSI